MTLFEQIQKDVEQLPLDKQRGKAHSVEPGVIAACRVLRRMSKRLLWVWH